MLSLMLVTASLVLQQSVKGKSCLEAVFACPSGALMFRSSFRFLSGSRQTAARLLASIPRRNVYETLAAFTSGLIFASNWHFALLLLLKQH